VRQVTGKRLNCGKLMTFRNGLNTEKKNFESKVLLSRIKVYSGDMITIKDLEEKVALASRKEERFALQFGDFYLPGLLRRLKNRILLRF